MKIKLTANSVGQEQVQVELEEVCEIGELGNVIRAFKQVLGSTNRASSSAAMPTDNRAPRSPRQVPMRPAGDFVPASDGQLKALWAAAANAGRQFEDVCQEYNVNPERISKKEAWRMTQDLNEETGYSQE